MQCIFMECQLKLFPSSLPSLTSMFSQRNGNASQPFDEMKLSSSELDNKIEKLKNKGYFTIPMSRATRTYLKKQDKPEADWRQSHTWKKLPLEPGYEETAIDMASAIVSRIAQSDVKLTQQEFEIRRPGKHGAVEWHQDSAPKLLACVATLEGRGTEFVSPATAKEKFTRSSNILSRAMELKGGQTSLGNAVKEAKKDRFYFFAACGIPSEHIPKLVHRAPPAAAGEESDRSIFIARWRINPQSNPFL